MNDTPGLANGGELSVELPPHARLAGLELRDDQHALAVTFTDGGDRVIPADQIVALCGASIRTEITSLESERLSGGPPLSSEGAMLVVALRTAGPGELLYLMADSFNFRKALGAEAGYSMEMNLRMLVRQLAALASRAQCDDFVMAIIHRVPLPPPLGSLMEFFKSAGPSAS